MKNNTFLIILMSLLFSACAVQKFVSPTTSISVEEAYKMTEKKVLLIDVREKEEVQAEAYQVKKVINLPLSELENHLTEIPKNKQVIVVCRSGKRSQKAYDLLKEKGFTNMTNMEGGLLKWQEKGLPIIKGQ